VTDSGGEGGDQHRPQVVGYCNKVFHDRSIGLGVLPDLGWIDDDALGVHLQTAFVLVALDCNLNASLVATLCDLPRCAQRHPPPVPIPYPHLIFLPVI
jgi:hypothetical protein